MQTLVTLNDFFIAIVPASAKAQFMSEAKNKGMVKENKYVYKELMDLLNTILLSNGRKQGF